MYCHAPHQRATVIWEPVADFIRASGHDDRNQQAGYMTAPDQIAKPTNHPLQSWGRPYMTVY